MSDASERAQGVPPTEIERTLRGMKRALWALTLMVALLIVVVIGLVAVPTFLMVSSFKSGSYVSEGASGGMPAGSAPVLSHSHHGSDYYNDFSDWPVSKQVAEASVIMVTRFVKDGDSMKEVVAEILKQAPGTEFYYRVGDAYSPWGDRSSRRVVQGADGWIVFLVDSPARSTFSVTYRTTEDAPDGRCDSLGGMTIKQLRELVQASAAAAPEKERASEAIKK